MERALCIGILIGGLAAPASAAALTLADALVASYDAEAAKDLPGATKPLEKLWGGNKNSYLLNLRLGWLKYCAGLWNESSVYYRKAVGLAPRALEPLQGLLLPLAAAGKTQDLIQVHEQILQLDPNNCKSLAALAWQYYLLKEYGEAADYYRRVVILYPTDTEMLVGLAASSLAGGDAEAARRYYREVLFISPKDKRALEGLKAR